MRSRPEPRRGAALVELSVYLAGVAVLAASVFGVFVQTRVAQQRAGATLAAAERSARVLDGLRAALATATGAPRAPSPSTLTFSDARGRPVTYVFGSDRLTRTVGAAAAARTEVVAVPCTGRFDLRDHGLVYVQVGWGWRQRPGAAVALDTLIRPGGPWRTR